MKVIIEIGRIIMKSCSDNLTEIGPHTKLQINFKSDSITEKTLYTLSSGESPRATKWVDEIIDDLYEHERLGVDSLLFIGVILLAEIEKNRTTICSIQGGDP